MQKKVANIVFYKFNGEEKNMVEACLFYEDGTVKNVTKAEAMKEAVKIAKEENEVDNFSSLINKKRIYVMSGAELTRRFNEFISYNVVENAIDNALDNITLLDNEDEKVLVKEKALEATMIPIQSTLVSNNAKKQEVKQNIEESKTIDNNSIKEEKVETKKVTPVVIQEIDLNEDNEVIDEPKKEDSREFVLRYEDPKTNETKEVVVNRNARENAEEKTTRVKTNEAKETKKSGKKLVKRRILPIAIASALISGGILTACSLNRTSKTGTPVTTSTTRIESEASINANDDIVILNNDNETKEENEVEIIPAQEISNPKNVETETKPVENISTEEIETETQESITTEETETASTGTITINNQNYNNYTYQQLLDVTTNAKQKEAMLNMSRALDWFNGTFADAYVEEGKDIRAALDWDEMIALQIAYNDYTKEELHAIFNGAEISANDMENKYKNATLQLMGAYVIEKEPNLVDVSMFVHSEEGIRFAQKYQNLLESAKNATGEAKLEAIKAFYQELYKDFPITEEIRTEGISHADTRKIESYKLAVAPMVAAAEIMFQNYEIDHTLTDQAIDYFNDLGLCNLAEDKFEKVEMITYSWCGSDIENPLYEQFREAKIKDLILRNIYVIDDAHRDLSQLDRFQELVNWHFQMIDGHFETSTWYTTDSYTTTKTWTETNTTTRTETTKTNTSDRNEAVRQAGEDKVRQAEEKVDQKIAEENRRAEAEGKRKAEENRQRMQEEANRQRTEQERTVSEDDQDMQDDIDNENEKIDQGQKVNEDDFGDHNVTFEDDVKDDNGNLDDSVKDITTDGTDAGKALEDPNETGKAFDEAGQKLPVEIDYDTVTDEVIDYEVTYDNELDDSGIDYDISYDEEIDYSEDTTATTNSEDTVVYEDLGTPNDNDVSNNDYSEEDYEIIYDEEIDYSEDNYSEPVVEQEAAPAPQPEPEHHEEPAPAPQPEPEHHEEPAPAPQPEPEHHEEPAPAPKSNEEIVNDYVESQANQPAEEEEEKTLVLE